MSMEPETSIEQRARGALHKKHVDTKRRLANLRQERCVRVTESSDNKNAIIPESYSKISAIKEKGPRFWNKETLHPEENISAEDLESLREIAEFLNKFRTTAAFHPKDVKLSLQEKLKPSPALDLVDVQDVQCNYGDKRKVFIQDYYGKTLYFFDYGTGTINGRSVKRWKNKFLPRVIDVFPRMINKEFMPYEGATADFDPTVSLRVYRLNQEVSQLNQLNLSNKLLEIFLNEQSLKMEMWVGENEGKGEINPQKVLAELKKVMAVFK